MTVTNNFAPGGYRYIPGPFQYSAGVAAEPGYVIVRVRFAEPVPLAGGFARIREYLTKVNRPLQSFCACELRSPAPFTEAGFKAFNQVYVGTLSEWKIFEGVVNPVARSNVCPLIAPPPEPSFYAFSYTAEIPDAPPSFIAAGSGEAPEGQGSYEGRIIRPGDVSPQGMREKAQFVLGEMEKRMKLLGFDWSTSTASQVYSVHDIFSLMATEIVRRGAARHGLTWHFCNPPVEGLAYEMDCRRVFDERII